MAFSNSIVSQKNHRFFIKLQAQQIIFFIYIETNFPHAKSNKKTFHTVCNFHSFLIPIACVGEKIIKYNKIITTLYH
jgi:hypothetical protein